MPKLLPLYIGYAGWAVPKQHAPYFPDTGTHLERYASVFPAVEINSSFYRPHQAKTYTRWAASVPEHFRFAVKVPKAITHTGRLIGSEAALDRFLDECTGLGVKLGPLLVQLPPSLNFKFDIVTAFCTALRKRFDGPVVCEPRHLTWFTLEAEELLAHHHVARVAADPALTPTAAEPGGWNGLVYYRLHGSPRIYYSDYSPTYLEVLSQRLSETAHTTPVWCIFYNTAKFAATGNALDVLERLRG